MNKEITKIITLKDGRKITISTGKLARQASRFGRNKNG